MYIYSSGAKQECMCVYGAFKVEIFAGNRGDLVARLEDVNNRV